MMPAYLKAILIDTICRYGQTDEKAVLTMDSRRLILVHMRPVILTLPRHEQLDMVFAIIDVLEQDGQATFAVRKATA